MWKFSTYHLWIERLSDLTSWLVLYHLPVRYSNTNRPLVLLSENENDQACSLTPSDHFLLLLLSLLFYTYKTSIAPPPGWRSRCLCNVSKHLRNIRGSQACQSCAKRPSVHPVEVGQMANLVPSLVNCLWQERWHIHGWTRAVLTKALQTVVDTVACIPSIREMLIIKSIQHLIFLLYSYSHSNVYWLQSFWELHCCFPGSNSPKTRAFRFQH